MSDVARHYTTREEKGNLIIYTPNYTSIALVCGTMQASHTSRIVETNKPKFSVSDTISTALQSRLYDDEKYVDKLVSVFTELANMYNTVTANCNKNAETLNRNIQLTEKRYAALMKFMQAKKSKTIE